MVYICMDKEREKGNKHEMCTYEHILIAKCVQQQA